jgi:Na+-driven multidrug efflux pump
LALAILNLAFNFLFIKGFNWGIEGSALATLLSISIINTWRLRFIYRKMHIQPLQTKMFYPILAGFVAVLLVYATPSVSNPFLSILIRGSVVTAVFSFVMVYFNVSPYIDAYVDKIKRRRR